MKESEVQDRIRFALDSYGRFFRANAGQGWTGQIISNDGQLLVLKNPRPFHGMPKGFTDLIGAVPLIITSEMVGKKLAIATFVEVKLPGEKPKEHQDRFMSEMLDLGAIVGVAKSVDEAIKIATGK